MALRFQNRKPAGRDMVNELDRVRITRAAAAK
jgi:hypothetical protein